MQISLESRRTFIDMPKYLASNNLKDSQNTQSGIMPLNYFLGHPLLRTDSEERYAYSLYGYGSVGKRVPILGTLDSDGPAHLEPLMEG